jgi:hypothetical protein
MWQLKVDQDNKRRFQNSATGSQCTQTMVYTDKEGNKWYSFDDLTAIPYTRNFAATKISSLYALGLSKDDLTGFISKQKAVLKPSDPNKMNDTEKYEKAYSLLMDFESKAMNATDAVKQMSSLVCVYFTINDEPIDSFDGKLQDRKMSILEADYEAHCFFLNSLINLTEHYTTSLNLLSQIVSQKPNGNAVRSV